MDAVEKYGGDVLHYIAEQYVRTHHKVADGYSVYTKKGEPLFGFVPADPTAPIHNLIWKK